MNPRLVDPVNGIGPPPEWLIVFRRVVAAHTKQSP